MPEEETTRSKPQQFIVLGLVVFSTTVIMLAYARFGDPRAMSRPLQNLAAKLGNAQIWRIRVPNQWILLCHAWDTWLGELQGEGERLLRTEGLWEPNDPLRRKISDFLANAAEIRPETLVPESAVEKRLAVLAVAPPDFILEKLQTPEIRARVDEAYAPIAVLAANLERWAGWERMRAVVRQMEDRGFILAAAGLRPLLPPPAGPAGSRVDTVRSLKLLNDLALDESGALLLLSRWNEVSRLTADLESSGDRIQRAMPALLLSRLVDQPSAAEFARSLEDTLGQLRLRRRQFLDPMVDRERFLKESPLQAESGEVTEADFSRWERELARFSFAAESTAR